MSDRLTYKEEIKNPSVYEQDLKKIAFKRIDTWIKSRYPMQYDELAQDIETKFNKMTGESSR